jgi:hypothetical protein
MLFADFILQNGLIALFTLYFIYEEFVNKQCKNAFIAFIALYGIGTYVPHFFAVLGSNLRNANTRFNHKPIAFFCSLL